jgi:DNA-binding NtrC family response regulator
MSGNVTLELAVEAMRLGATDVVAAPFDPREMVARWAATEPDPFLHLDAAESRHIRKVLGLCGGNITLAAERLRISRRGLQGKLQRLCGCTEPARGKS